MIEKQQWHSGLTSSSSPVVGEKETQRLPLSLSKRISSLFQRLIPTRSFWSDMSSLAGKCTQCLRRRSLTKRLCRQQKSREGGWVTLSNPPNQVGTIIKWEAPDRVCVRLLDFLIHPSKWTEQSYSKEEVSPYTYVRAENVEDLLSHLTQCFVSRREEVRTLFADLHREIFCKQTPFWDVAVDLEPGACISTPHIHIIVLELLWKLFPKAEAILDIGSGSGFVTAAFAKAAPHAQVVGIECSSNLIKFSRWAVEQVLTSEECERVTFLKGDGKEGRKGEHFDIINVAFMCRGLPSPLVEQLKPQGKMIIPLSTGTRSSYEKNYEAGWFVLIEKCSDGTIEQYPMFKCSFVPSRSGESPSLLSKVLFFLKGGLDWIRGVRPHYVAEDSKEKPPQDESGDEM